MIPFHVVLFSMGLLTAEYEPKRSEATSKRRSIAQSVYSIHNYKQPYATTMTRQQGKQLGVTVEPLLTQPLDYKHPQRADWSKGSMTVDYTEKTNLPNRNYKNQLSTQ